jgi:hypothetical protein
MSALDTCGSARYRTIVLKMGKPMIAATITPAYTA